MLSEQLTAKCLEVVSLPEVASCFVVEWQLRLIGQHEIAVIKQAGPSPGRNASGEARASYASNGRTALTDDSRGETNGLTPLSSSELEAAHRFTVASQVALQRDFPALPGRLFGRVRSIRSFGERAVFADRPVKMSREHWIGQNGQGEGVRRIIIGHAAPWHETPCRAKSPGRIAQPDRAPAFEAGGCRFKSCCGRQRS